ncbi:MAG: LysR family transcriptional regulator [Bacteriovoracaceae bacterium]|nr:LysR family transcriptional regulator [Bacteriovoracaceae bacterium]
MNSWLNYHHLIYFKTIAEEQSVSKAAKKLRLAQSTVSTQLLQFEEQLGIKLFERENKKLILTERGKIALRYAQDIFKLGNEMSEILSGETSLGKSHIHIGALDGIGKQISMKLTQMAYDYQPCVVTISEGTFRDLTHELTEHRIDLVLSNYPLNIDTKTLKSRTLTKKNIEVFGAKKYRKLSANFPKSLNGQKVILPTFDSRIRSEINSWLIASNLEVEIIAETQDIALTKMMGIEGMGLIFLPEYSVAKQIDTKDLYSLGTLSSAYEELFLLTSQRTISNPLIEHLFKTFSID